eukprot:1153088-Pelagomonas_calceolata.AAC.12
MHTSQSLILILRLGVFLLAWTVLLNKLQIPHASTLCKSPYGCLQHSWDEAGRRSPHRHGSGQPHPV